MTGFVGRIVGRYVRSRRGFTRVVTVFSVIGIMLGVAALIAVLAVMSGFRQELTGRILGVTGHATVRAAGMDVAAARYVVEEVRKIDGVVSAEPVVQGQAMVSAGGRSAGVMLRGMSGELPAYVAEKLIAHERDVQADDGGMTRGQRVDDGGTMGVVGGPDAIGGLSADEKPDGDEVADVKGGIAPGEVLLGNGLVRALGVLPGGGVQLLSATGQRTIAGFIPASMPATVGGMFQFGMVQFDNSLVLANLGDVQRLLRLGDRVQGVEIRIAKPETIGSFKVQLGEAVMRGMGRAGQAVQPFEVGVETWEDTNQEFFRALQVERVTMFIILSLIVLVAAFNIITGQMMLVSDKLHDIAILRTMGATRAQVQRIFFLNGILLGSFGVAGGVALGMLIVWQMPAIVDGVKVLFGVNLFPGDVYFLTELPARVNTFDMGTIVGLAMVLTVLASWYPAWRAGKFTPVELLRGA